MYNQVGICSNCGACCYITYPDGKQRICFNYNVKSSFHCKIYSHRPLECRDFPRGPMDLERVKQWCSIRFVDDNGRVVDGYMDKRVGLSKHGK